MSNEKRVRLNVAPEARAMLHTIKRQAPDLIKSAIEEAASDAALGRAGDRFPQPGHPITTAHELATIGRAMYGTNWRHDMARDLGMKSPRSIQRWVSGVYAIPDDLHVTLSVICRKRAVALRELGERLTGARS